MKEHLLPAAIAAIVAGGATLGINTMSKPTPPQIVVSQAGVARAGAWEDLTQQEVDALTAELKKMKPQQVAIFCSSLCDGLALDFDNAFESAKWQSGIERPLTDTNTGINVAPNDAEGKALAAAIKSATNGRLSPGLLDAAIIGNRLALVISRKK